MLVESTVPYHKILAEGIVPFTSFCCVVLYHPLPLIEGRYPGQAGREDILYLRNLLVGMVPPTNKFIHNLLVYAAGKYTNCVQKFI